MLNPTTFPLLSYCIRSTPSKTFDNNSDAETLIYGILRYQEFPEFIKVLIQLGPLDAYEKEWMKKGSTWAQVMQNGLSTNNANEVFLTFSVVDCYKLTSIKTCSCSYAYLLL
jgi:saccharopine dehydrogenase-like NADP-dependent oxidoreductase